MLYNYAVEKEYWFYHRKIILKYDPVYASHTRLKLKLGATNWRAPSLSELTPMLFDVGLPHLGSEAFILGLQKNLLNSI